MRILICILALSSSAFAITYNCSTFTLPPGDNPAGTSGFNNSGTVSGSYFDKNNVRHGFMFTPAAGNFRTIDYPGADQTFLFNINNNGVAVGEAFFFSAGTHPFFTVDSSGTIHNLVVPPGDQIDSVYGINDTGDVSATVLEPDNTWNAVIHPDGTVTNYVVSPFVNGAGSLNNSLTMVVTAATGAELVDSSGHITTIVDPNFPNTTSAGIADLNNAGTVIGGVVIQQSISRNYLRDSAGVFSEPICPNVNLNAAAPSWVAINDNGVLSAGNAIVIATPLPGLAQTTLSASSITFPSTGVGQPSAPQTVVVSNSGNARLDIGAFTVIVSSGSSATFTTSGCVAPLSLDPGASCTLTLNATPNASGVQTATLLVEDSAPNAPHAISLSVAGDSGPSPTCNVGAINPGPPASVSFSMADTTSGLASIVVTQSTNATASVQSFQRGTTSPVNASATQIATGQSASVQFQVTNVAGRSTSCGSTFAGGSGGPAVWTGLGGSIVGRPSPANNPDGRFEVVAEGSDSTIDDIAQSAAGGAWNGFSSLGGFITGNAVIAANQNGVLEAFARGGDNALWTTSQSAPGGPWSGSFTSLGGTLISDSAVGINSNGTLDVFVLGTDNGLWHNAQTSPGGSFGGWTGLGGTFTGLPAVVANQDGRLQVFARGTDNSLWTLAQITPGGSWSAPVSLGGFLKSNPAAALNTNGIVQAFVVGGDTSIWTIAQASAGNSAFSGFIDLGGSANADPSIAVNADGRLEAFVLGGDNALWHNSQTSAGGSTWSGWSSLQGQFQGAPSSIRGTNGEIAVFVRAPNNTLWYIQQTSAGGWN